MFLAGVTVGDPVLRTGRPLSVELGPGKVALPVALRHKLLHVLYFYILHMHVQPCIFNGFIFSAHPFRHVNI